MDVARFTVGKRVFINPATEFVTNELTSRVAPKKMFDTKLLNMLNEDMFARSKDEKIEGQLSKMLSKMFSKRVEKELPKKLIDKAVDKKFIKNFISQKGVEPKEFINSLDLNKFFGIKGAPKTSEQRWGKFMDHVTDVENEKGVNPIEESFKFRPKIDDIV